MKPQEPLPSSWRFQCRSAGGRAEARCVKSPRERPQSTMRCKWGLAHTNHNPGSEFEGEVQRHFQKSSSPLLFSWKLENCSLQTPLAMLCQERSVICLTFMGRILSLSGWGSEQSGLSEGVPPWQGVCNEVVFRVLPNPNHSVVP